MSKNIFAKISKYLPQIIAMLFLAGFAVPVQAAVSDNVSGYAWSDNIGWISFNGTNYGVNINQTSGKLSGYAWSDNIGWINFNEADLSGCPSGACLAKASPSGQLGKSNVNILGWARALSNGGGWDGWIRFDHGQASSTYIDSTGNFRGYAWGSDVVGWISFDHGNVVLNLSGFNQPPDKPTFSSPVETWDNCSLENNSKPTLYWQYFDPEGDPQDAYQVLVDNNPGFSSPEIDSCIENTTCNPGNSSKSYTPITNLNWSTTYYWKVKVKDNQGNWSNFSNSESFTTVSHAYPWIDFNWLPVSAKAKELIQFSSASTTFYGVGGKSWAWDFGDTGTASAQNPSHSYLTSGTYLVKLGICDNSNYCCAGADAKQKSIQISLPLPEWKEIAPF